MKTSFSFRIKSDIDPLLFLSFRQIVDAKNPALCALPTDEKDKSSWQQINAGGIVFWLILSGFAGCYHWLLFITILVPLLNQ